MRSRITLVLVIGAVVWSMVPAGATRLSGTFTDDDSSIHEPAIEAIAARGITRGCNPPDNDRFCPESVVTRAQMAAFLRRAFEPTLSAGPGVSFSDTSSSEFSDDIEWLAATGVTKGCNPPANSRYCPTQAVTRGQMAAFLTRALSLGSRGTVDFRDDDTSVFEPDIERIAAAGITVGCNPPTNDRFCPDAPVTREQMASFLARALDLPQLPPIVDLARGWSCAKDGLSCSGTATSGPERRITIAEGWDQALPALPGEESAFRSSVTRFELLVDGVTRRRPAPVETSTSAALTRRWTHQVVTPPSGSFVLEGRWYWEDRLVRRTRVVVTID